jgi:hypothetical protein
VGFAASILAFLAGIKNRQRKAVAEKSKMKGYKTKKYLINAAANVYDSLYVQQVTINSWNKTILFGKAS